MNRLVAVPILLFIMGIILPPEISIKIGSLRISVYRMVLMIGLLPWLYMLITNKRYGFCLVDKLLIMHACWVFLALAINEGFAFSIESGGIYVVETLGAYLIARIYIRNIDQFKALAKVIFTTVLVLGIAAIPEFTTGWHYIREIFGLHTDGLGSRYGLHRVFGPFDHPILYGVFCASAISMTYYLLGQGKISLKSIALCTAVTIAAVMSISGGPLLALLSQIILLTFERLTRSINRRWSALFILAIIGYLATDLLSNRSPIVAVTSYISFSGHTAYMRVLIFEHGILEVINNPFFGIGYAEWVRPNWMPPSVDNFWLLMAMRYGVPALVFLLSAIIYLALKTAGNKPTNPEILLSRRAWGFTLFGLLFVGCTVAFWNSLFVWFYFLIGSGVWMITSEQKSTCPVHSVSFSNIKAKQHKFLFSY